MNRWKRLIRRLLWPGRALTCALLPAAAGLLAAVFVFGLEDTPSGCAVFGLSAYALAVAVAAVPGGIRAARGVIEAHEWANRLLLDREYQAWLALRAGLGVNLSYAALKLCAGGYLGSVWMTATGAYYAVLAAIRFGLLRGDRNSGNRREGWRACRRVGWLMLALSVAMNGMIVQMVRDDRAYRYPGVLIYAAAAYAFYRLTVAAGNLIRRRRDDAPLLAAARTVSFAGALMALFGLQTALLAQFGGGEEGFRRMMNAIVGGVTGLTTCVMAVRMIGRARLELRRAK